MQFYISKGVKSRLVEHPEFQELCGLFWAGTLNDEEHARLQEHLSQCLDCQSFLERFPQKAAAAMSALASKCDSEVSPAASFDAEAAKKRLFEKISKDVKDDDVPSGGRLEYAAVAMMPRYAAPSPSVSQPAPFVRNLKPYLPHAAGLLLALGASLALYRNGPRTPADEIRVTADPAETDAVSSRQQIKELSGERDALNMQLQDRADHAQVLGNQITQLRHRVAELEATGSTSEKERQELYAVKEDLAKNLESAQATVADLRTELDSSRRLEAGELLKVAELERRVQQLSASVADQRDKLKQQDATLDSQREMLSHDRDIRNLMGARKLYMAEVYDSDEEGRTKKPYARVFYTKDQSLIFYGFDLDKQPGLKNASTFQAWGRRGPNHEQVNLGILFEDSSSDKHWIMKIDDPAKLEQIDAVFVTVEPKGGSARPTSKPLLLAYLRVDPNHP